MTNKIEQLQKVFDNAIVELMETFDELKTEIINVDKPEYETEKRKALTGDRVIITCGRHKGCVFTVKRHEESELFWGIDVEGLPKEPYIWTFVDSDYEVIIEPEQVPIIKELTANQQREELIERAKKFVEVKLGSLMNSKFVNGGYEAKKRENPNFCEWATKAEFIVNKEKSTVVALLKGARDPKIYSRGIAKCMPDEVFNEHIGKAIALARALEIDVPEEFMNAVQPDEIVVGMEVVATNIELGDSFNHIVDIHSLDSVQEDYSTHNRCWRAKIISDTNAIYKEGELK